MSRFGFFALTSCRSRGATTSSIHFLSQSVTNTGIEERLHEQFRAEMMLRCNLIGNIRFVSVCVAAVLLRMSVCWQPHTSTSSVSAFTVPCHRVVFHNTRHGAPSTSFVSSSSSLLQALPSNYQDYGNECIARAAVSVGARVDQIHVTWKPGRIIVTVQGDVHASIERDVNEDDEEDIVVAEDDDDDDDDDNEDNVETVEETEDIGDDNLAMMEPNSIPISPSSIDLTALARAVNDAFNDDGVGLTIAELHEIEVTTPGASDELHTLSTRQFQSYKGFDVTVIHADTKTKATKTIQGRIVSRDDETETTVINIKGRMKKLSNQDIQSIKLPKAKKE
jgi:hypothetical protein